MVLSTTLLQNNQEKLITLPNGINFKKFQLTDDGLKEIIRKSKGLSEEEVAAIKKIKETNKSNAKL